MVKRFTDVLLATLALLVLWPVLLIAAIAVRFSSRGPITYLAKRIGVNGREFRMFKIRTMHVDHGGYQSVITATNDPRVFLVGEVLRKLKVDELPQLFNVLRGDMSIVGPRPEDPRMVREHYWPEHQETLIVRPGLASPGSIYNYTHGQSLLGSADPERDYIERLLPIKLALDVVYVRRASVWYDARIVARTLVVIIGLILGRRVFPVPRELAEAEELQRQWAPARRTHQATAVVAAS